MAIVTAKIQILQTLENVLLLLIPFTFASVMLNYHEWHDYLIKQNSFANFSNISIAFNRSFSNKAIKYQCCSVRNLKVWNFTLYLLRKRVKIVFLRFRFLCSIPLNQNFGEQMRNLTEFYSDTILHQVNLEVKEFLAEPLFYFNL